MTVYTDKDLIAFLRDVQLRMPAYTFFYSKEKHAETYDLYAVSMHLVFHAEYTSFFVCIVK